MKNKIVKIMNQLREDGSLTGHEKEKLLKILSNGSCSSKGTDNMF